MMSFGLCSRASALDLVHVDALVVRRHAVGHHLEPLARHVDGRAVGEMAAGGEIEAHEGVAGLHQRQEHRLVGLGAGIRLHVGELAAEQLRRRARWRASRRCRRTGSRHSSAGPDSPRRTCWSSPSPAPRARRGRRCSRRRSARSRRAGGRAPCRWRRAISGSRSARRRGEEAVGADAAARGCSTGSSSCSGPARAVAVRGTVRRRPRRKRGSCR